MAGPDIGGASDGGVPDQQLGSGALLTADRRGASGRSFDPAWRNWDRPRRWPAVLAVVLAVLAFVGILIWHDNAHSVPPRVVLLPTAPSAFKPPYVPGATGQGATIQKFAGTSSVVGTPFTASGKLLIMNAQCHCSSNFVVTVTGPGGLPGPILVNAIGKYSGTLNATVPAGTYSLNVRASGPWTIQLIEPVSVPAIATPFSYFSGSDSVVGPFTAADNNVTFRFLSLTDGSVTASVINADGATVSTPFAGTGKVAKQETLTGLPNPYYLEIQAGGFWSIDVAQSKPG
jgi:hypothetical protein